MRAVRQAADGWAEAMRAHKLAPPDAGFAGRLNALAEAAAAEQVAVGARPRGGAPLAPGAGRREGRAAVRAATGNRPPRARRPCGSGSMTAVAALNRAITGSDAAQVADAFGEMSEAAGALADAVAGEDAAAVARGAA